MPLPNNKRVRPKTYTVAVYLVGAILGLEVIMFISVFWLRAMVVSVNTHAPKPKNGLPPPAPTLVHLPPPIPTGPEMPRLPGLSIGPNSTPLLQVPGQSDTLAQVGKLNDDAQALLHQNDLRHAAQALQDAEDLDPRNPTTLKNEAETYYLMNNSARAKIYWQRLADLGPEVGTIYGVARDHVLLLDSTPDASALSEPSPFPRLTYIDNVEKTPIETSDGQPKFHLRAVLKKKTMNEPFDQKKLQVFVIFYLQTPDGRLLPDLSQHKGAFENTLLFWNNELREPFGVDYVMPVAGATTGDYYGFVIGIYYNKILQDERSEPSDLLKRIPLPDAIE